jgi:hypothetical protein
MPKSKIHYGRPHGDTAVPLCGILGHATYRTSVEADVTCQRCQRYLAVLATGFVPTCPPAWLPPTAWPSSLYTRKGGGRCPICQSGAITGTVFACAAPVAWQDVSCTACGAAWQDGYMLQGYDRLDLSAYHAPGETDEQEALPWE